MNGYYILTYNQNAWCAIVQITINHSILPMWTIETFIENYQFYIIHRCEINRLLLSIFVSLNLFNCHIYLRHSFSTQQYTTDRSKRWLFSLIKIRWFCFFVCVFIFRMLQKSKEIGSSKRLYGDYIMKMKKKLLLKK